MINDPGQRLPVQDQADSVFTQLMLAKSNWEKNVLTELQPEVVRPFTIGHPNFSFTQLPARDAMALGNIKRSNRWPNCSFFTNWTSLEDSITWEVDILSSGRYKAQIYYTCPKTDIGSTIQLSFKSTSITYSISEDLDPPLVGMEHDRVIRGESYVKDFKPMDIGVIDLPKGIGKLVLKATKIPGNQVMDFRLLMLDKI